LDDDDDDDDDDDLASWAPDYGDSEQEDTSAAQTAPLRETPAASSKQPGNEDPGQVSENKIMEEPARMMEDPFRELTSQEITEGEIPISTQEEEKVSDEVRIGRMAHHRREVRISYPGRAPVVHPPVIVPSYHEGYDDGDDGLYHPHPLPRRPQRGNPQQADQRRPYWGDSDDNEIISESGRYEENLTAQKSGAESPGEGASEPTISLPAPPIPPRPDIDEWAAARSSIYLATPDKPWIPPQEPH